jgi:hypothetical protein
MLRSNIDVAKEQLSYAVGLFFNKSEISVVATLGFSAYGILIDLLKDKDCFRDWMQEDHPGVSPKAMWLEWNVTWGFFKHGKNGVEQRTIDENLIEIILFAAIYDFQTLPEKLNTPNLPKPSIEMDIYRFWFCAKNEGIFPCEHENVLIAKSLFPNIATLDKEEKIELGRKMLSKQKIL